MPDESSITPSQAELLDITRRMLQSIHSGDADTYRGLCAPELSCFETDVAPYRIDGIDFHVSLIREMHDRTVYDKLVRFDMLTPLVQLYGDTAIVSYTRLMTYRTETSPIFRSFNETRVFARDTEGWKMVHFHRSEGAA